MLAKSNTMSFLNVSMQWKKMLIKYIFYAYATNLMKSIEGHVQKPWIYFAQNIRLSENIVGWLVLEYINFKEWKNICQN